MTTLAFNDAEQKAYFESIDCFERIQTELDMMVDFHKPPKYVPVSKESLQAYMRKAQEALNRRWKELRETILMMQEAVQDEMLRLTKHSLHRTQGRSGKGKTSAKKTAKSSGNGGGDSDGDGPDHRRNKQRRPSSIRNNSSQRPPTVPPGTLATTSSQQSPPSPPSKRSQDRGLSAFIATILLVFIFVLIAYEEREMAWAVLVPVVGALTKYLNPPDKKH